MSLELGLQVVVPRGYDLARIPALIERKQKWIERTQQRFAAYQSKVASEPVEKLPAQIVLAAINETWEVEYLATNARVVRLCQTGAQKLTLTGAIASELACRRVLRRWLCQKGSETLVPWLQKVSVETQLPFAKAAVRMQRTRWGSCSRRKTISLNAKLLFLRPELVRYLFIHELSHLVHMNHSVRYWNFVESKAPGYKVLDREMRTAMRLVPRWV
jgi:predicted metal-dependent hydrolase